LTGLYYRSMNKAYYLNENYIFVPSLAIIF